MVRRILGLVSFLILNLHILLQKVVVVNHCLKVAILLQLLAIEVFLEMLKQSDLLLEFWRKLRQTNFLEVIDEDGDNNIAFPRDSEKESPNSNGGRANRRISAKPRDRLPTDQPLGTSGTEPLLK